MQNFNKTTRNFLDIVPGDFSGLASFEFRLWWWLAVVNGEWSETI